MDTSTIDDATHLARVRALVRSGAALRIRIDAGLSLAEVAATVGVTTGAISRWERRKRSPHGGPALRYLELLEALLERDAR
jgi:DNA-binding transcriptional regulator YiaG